LEPRPRPRGPALLTLCRLRARRCGARSSRSAGLRSRCATRARQSQPTALHARGPRFLGPQGRADPGLDDVLEAVRARMPTAGPFAGLLARGRRRTSVRVGGVADAAVSPSGRSLPTSKRARQPTPRRRPLWTNRGSRRCVGSARERAAAMRELEQSRRCDSRRALSAGFLANGRREVAPCLRGPRR
jgi:hypothetical protein